MRGEEKMHEIIDKLNQIKEKQAEIADLLSDDNSDLLKIVQEHAPMALLTFGTWYNEFQNLIIELEKVVEDKIDIEAINNDV